MLNFVIRKMLNKKWMAISLLLGNLLMIAIAAAIPLYSEAILQRTLTSHLNTFMAETNSYPGTVSFQYSHNKNTGLDKLAKAEEMLTALSETWEVPALETVSQYYKSGVTAYPDILIEYIKESHSMKLTSYSDIADHIQIIYGNMYTPGLKEENVFEVIVNKRTFEKQNLALDEYLSLPKLTDANGVPYRIKIVGVFENSNAEDPYWLSSPNKSDATYVMDYDLFQELFVTPDSGQGFSAEYHTILDYTAIRSDQASFMKETMADYLEEFKELSITIKFYFQDIIETFIGEADKVTITIWVLQTPIFFLLIAFIFMVSRQMLESEQNDISVFKSRGASKNQLVRLYLLQSILLALLGLVLGVPLGVMICKMLGASNAFLEFVRRGALTVRITPTVLLFACGAAFISICTMVIPVFKFANVSIVNHKRQKNRKNKRTIWKLLGLDFILIAVSLYGLYNFNKQEAYLLQQVMEGAALDPTLYLYSSLFLFGCGLLVLRILPLIIQLVFQIGKKWWPPALQASFLRILRTNDNQGFMVVFLILTVALGIFSTKTARTINANAEDRLYYSVGADIVLAEEWSDNSGAMTLDENLTFAFEEPRFEKYEKMEGIESVTKVLVDESIVTSVPGGVLNGIQLMGINTKEFGETAWFKDSLLDSHWYDYLNAMSQNSRAVLVSSNFQKKYGYEIGDTITYRHSKYGAINGVIYGFVDYWPTYAPSSTVVNKDGTQTIKDNYLIVAHLSQIQSVWGITPYQVWINAKDSTQFIYDYAAETRTNFEFFEDAASQVIAQKNDPVFQGTNGVLTIGFIIVLLLCTTGFLIYWIMSIQSRTLQFGIFRAMGMSKNEILSMLGIEQIFISGTSIAAGVLVGHLGADLFVPLIQIAYSSSERAIPLEIISQTSDYIRLGVVIGAMIVLCMVILGILISKIRIAQALKLGED